ncbi:hypothetical protein UA08_04065 [Talaromyces atroroseus]|uniref:Protein argonaute n=1 Tax=Talaromyces atroroseus TaxID=1441469 RepID=A0A1Q5Q948_TALAT|nr:hypothetical protein UA08_04065 [Talaromyces atroroseus]OKL60549.1 hypothetical protein UA08_04065 [Talaromyces atroroseus]
MASLSGDPAREPKPFVNPYKNLDLPPVAFTLGKPPHRPLSFSGYASSFAVHHPSQKDTGMSGISGPMPLRAAGDKKEPLTFTKTDNVFQQYVDGVTNVARPGFNTTGREVELQVNAYPITKFPTQNVFQYDVTIVKVGKEHEAPPPRARKLVWDSPARKNKYKQILFDGSKLAWSCISYDDPHGVLVDLSAHPGGNGNGNTPGYRLIVRKSKSINLQVLEQWLLKKGPFDERVLEAMNFLDHLLREWPSTKFTPIKRAFYDQTEEGHNFDNTIDIRKGFYQAIRPAMGGRLVVNVDSVLCAFWRQVSLISLADSFLEKFDWGKTAQAMKPKNVDPHASFRGYVYSPAHRHIWNKLKHLEVKPVFEGNTVNRTFNIHAITTQDAHTKKFKWTDSATGRERDISVFDYFKQKYNKTLFCPQLPVVEMTKKDTFYPMECLHVAGLQRYNHKLSERQTTDMLKMAVRRPQMRFGDIVKAKAKLNHGQDPILQHFGMQISPNMLVTKARLLPSPEIQFGGNAKISPQTQGRWDLRGKKFLEANKTPLKSWGVGIIKQGRGALPVAQAEEWTQGFMKQYAGHGGKVVSRPTIMELTGDTAEAVYRLFMATGNNAKQRPQLLLFIAPNKDVMVYNRIKKSCDCRFGVPSQVVQKAHVEKKMPQYMSNVAMKVNAKLGGVTCKAVPRQSDAMHRPGSIIIGADVSHAAPGSFAPSLAAISVSADQNGAKYMGSCQTGDSRVEIINEYNMKEMLTPLVDEWTKTVGNGRRPQNVYYFRDGVSTGQFAQVLEKEVPVIKDVIFNGSGDKVPPKITVVIGNKRHHIRGAPRPTDKTAGDKNGNALPGTLIERDVTSPHDWDFLLIAHVALQGTAQPVHYHVIRDEMKHQPAQLQNMIYNHCYQYVRSTTSVSLFPAIYYAHLISNRARCQSADEFVEGSDESPENSGPKQGGPKPLLPMAKNETRNNLEMWFV